MQHESARTVALRILACCFGAPPTAPTLSGLEPFQQDAVQRIQTLLDRRGGAILADSVGLGKTHVAATLIGAAAAGGASVLVSAPAQLKAHWARHLRGISSWRWVSHTSMSRGSFAGAADLVVVDEAHAFRNAETRRYAALALACERARVLLLTATPVNNSIFDFYHLVRLFAPRDLFIDIGVPDLLGAFECAARGGDAGAVRRVAEAVMVRRTRRVVTHTAAATPTLRFPTCAGIESLHYDLRETSPQLIDEVRRTVPALQFPAHRLESDGGARELMRLGLLKRLESSTAALHASVCRHISLLEYFRAAACDGLLFDARTHAAHVGIVDGALQLSLDPLVLPRWPPALDRAALLDTASRDLRALRRLMSHLRDVDRRRDPKLALLRELLGADLRDETVLVFTEFQETARLLWRALSTRAGIALVHGADARLGRARSSRRAIIERFAPHANHARVPRAAERVRVLIATDVLAEGLDLQDARVVISYDLPWNPVRLAQRIGRIDRLGSPHERIRALAFVPDRGVDEMLRLMKRIRRKLRDIRIVGGDAPALHGSRAARHMLEEFNDAAEAREIARAVFLAHAHSAHNSGASRGAPAVGAMRWQQPGVGALCCFRLTDTAATLVLTRAAGAPEIDTALAWSILTTAIESPEDQAAMLSVTAADPRPSEAERAARRALRGRDRLTPPNRSERGAALASAAILRWLADRPGGASEAEADHADALLRRLQHGGRAGAALRIARVMRGSTSADDVIRSLAAALAGTDHHGDGPPPRVSAHLRNRRGTAPRPALIGVLLLSPASPTGATASG